MPKYYCGICTKDLIIILRRDMESHKTTCVFRPYTCEYCSMVGTYLSVTNNARGLKLNRPSHYDKCEHYPLECPNKCGEENIKRKDIQTHRDACPLEPLECTLGSHPTSILRKYMEKHRKEECEFRPYSCKHCGFYGTYLSITGNGRSQKQATSHYSKCCEYPLECPNRCGVNKIKRKNLKTHRYKCSLEVVECPFKYVNCTKRIQRKNIDSHCQEGIHNHLRLLAKSHQKLACKNKRLAHINENLSQKCIKMSRDITALTRTCQNMSKTLECSPKKKKSKSRSSKRQKILESHIGAAVCSSQSHSHPDQSQSDDSYFEDEPDYDDCESIYDYEDDYDDYEDEPYYDDLEDVDSYDSDSYYIQ